MHTFLVFSKIQQVLLYYDINSLSTCPKTTERETKVSVTSLGLYFQLKESFYKTGLGIGRVQKGNAIMASPFFFLKISSYPLRETESKFEVLL